MKKVIFISALAVAAAVSCNKSEIVDTKFNEQISFENYIGRDAMTKGAVIDEANIVNEEIGLYGFYTGAKEWSNAQDQIADPSANLWTNERLYCSDKTTTPPTWSYDGGSKYWTNASDFYSFLAYAPKAADNGISVAGNTANTVNVTYACPVAEDTKLTTSVDLLYAQVVNTTKGDGSVDLSFKHALSRVTVKAYAPATNNSMGMQFDVKKVTLSGTFNTAGTLNLATAKAAAGDVTTDAGWSVNDSDKKTAYYVFCDEPAAATIGEDGKATDALLATVETAVDYSGKTADAAGNNYLMMIPTNFNGTLTVTYTTIYAGQESKPMTKELPIATNFMMGKAYAITLAFEPVLDVITFNVAVETWGNEDPVNTTNGNNPEKYPVAGQN